MKKPVPSLPEAGLVLHLRESRRRNLADRRPARSRRHQIDERLTLHRANLRTRPLVTYQSHRLRLRSSRGYVTLDAPIGAMVSRRTDIDKVTPLKLSHIRNLVSIAQRGGLRRAARHLGVAQPAISRSIRELETELGTDLFIRNARGMELTPAGEAFYRRVRAVQIEIDRARDEVHQLSGLGVGTVTVALSTAAIVALLPKAIEPFHKRYPDVLLRISEGLFANIEGHLRAGSIDFYIGPPSEFGIATEFASEKLFDNRRVVLARKGHRAADARSLADIAGEKWIATSVTTDQSAELSPLFERHGLPPPLIAAQTEGGLATIATLLTTDFLTLLPMQWADFAERTGSLEVIPVREEIAAPPIYVIARSGLPLTPVSQYFVDLVRRAASHIEHG